MTMHADATGGERMRGNSRVNGDWRVTGAGLVGAGICATLALYAVPAGAATLATRSPAASPDRLPPNRGPVRPRKRGTRAGHRVPQGPAGAEPGATARIDQRSALIQAAQAPYLDQLEQLGATDVHSYQLVNAISARVPAGAQARISDSPGVAAVIPDSPIVGPSPSVATGGVPGRLGR